MAGDRGANRVRRTVFLRPETDRALAAYAAGQRDRFATPSQAVDELVARALEVEQLAAVEALVLPVLHRAVREAVRAELGDALKTATREQSERLAGLLAKGNLHAGTTRRLVVHALALLAGDPDEPDREYAREVERAAYTATAQDRGRG